MKLMIQENDVVCGDFTLSPVGLTSNGLPEYKDWVACGEFIRKANKSVHFWIGDWLNFGEGAYGEKYAQVLDSTNFKLETLQNDKWVSSKVPLSRRREHLTWSHHAEVADLLPEDQSVLLDEAEKQNLTTKDFRKLVRKYKLKQEVPELKDEVTPTDFVLVQEVIDPSLDALERLQQLNLDRVHKDARDYLLSHLKQSVGIMVSILTKYKRNTDEE